MPTLKLLTPHEGQTKITENRRRFSVIVCARRFGKTELISAVDPPLIWPVLQGKLVAVFAPVFKDVAPLWDNIISRYGLAPGGLISKKDETKKVIHFITGGRLDFWSLKDKSAQENGRGRKYHLVIYEESQKINDDVLRHNWTKAIRPTLSDFGGRAVFIGTADGREGFFYNLCRRGAAAGAAERNHDGDLDLPATTDGGDDWITFRMITTDNPFIPPAEVKAAAADLDDLTYRQEYFSEFINYAGSAWCYALTDKAVQNRVFIYGSAAPVANFSAPLYLSFDFNKIPMTAIAAQLEPLPLATVNRALNYNTKIHVVKEFKVGEKKGEVKNEASIYDTCQLIRSWIYEKTGKKIGRWTDGGTVKTFNNPFHILVTGDASGDAADGRQRVPKTYYDIICEELSLNRRTQLKIPSKNPYHAASYVQVNTILQRHPDVKINADTAPNLRRDMLTIKADNKRGIIKASGDGRQADLLDCFRYLLNTFCK
jgi:hypothetical protein